MTHAQLAAAILTAPFLTVAVLGMVAEILRIRADQNGG